VNLKSLLNIKAARDEILRLETALAEASAERDVEKAGHEAARSEIARLTAQHDAQVAELTAQLSERAARVSVLEADAVSAEQRAAQIIAAQAIPADALPSSAATQGAPSVEALASQIRSETNPQKRAALFAQLQTLWKQSTK